MLFGHIGVGLAAKSTAPKVSLSVLLMSAEVLDLLCSLFGLAGIENLEVGTSWVPWSHGLFMSVVWSLTTVGIAFLYYRDLRTGIIIGGLVFSHWVLDFISWATPLPLMFNYTSVISGLGLGNLVPLEVVVEFGALIGGMVIYVITTKRHPMLVKNPQLGREQARKIRTYLISSWSVVGGSVVGLGIWSTSTALTTIFLIALVIGILCGSEAINRFRGANRILQETTVKQ